MQNIQNKRLFNSFVKDIPNKLKFVFLSLFCVLLISCSTNKSKNSEPTQSTSNELVAKSEQSLISKSNNLALSNIKDQSTLTQLLIAEIAITNQKFPTALEIYWRLAQQKQSAELAQRSLYVAQYIDEKIMLDSAQLWAKLAKKDVEAQKVAAGLLLEKGLYIKSLPYLEDLAKLENRSNYMLLVNSVVNKDIKILPDILPFLQRTEQEIQPDADLYTALAFVYHYLEKTDLSKEYLDKALKIDKNFLSAILLKANIFKREQKFKKAEKILLDAQKRNPTQIRIYLNLAKLQIENGKKDLAKKTLDTMIQYADKDAQTSLTLAYYLESVAMLEEAEILSKKLVKSKKYQDRANLLLAKISLENKQIEQAFTYLNKVNTTSTGFIEATYFGVLVAYKYYNSDAAIKWLNEKKEYAAQNLTQDLMDFLITSYKALTEAKASATLRKQWLDDSISTVGEIGLDDSELIYLRAFFWYEQKDLESMEADLRNLVENNKDEPRYLNALAFILIDEDKNLAQSEKLIRYKEGLLLAQAAYDLEKSVAIKDTLGWAFYKNRRFKQALPYLEEAHRIKPKDDEIAGHLVVLLWAMGKDKEAKSLVQKLLNLEQPNTHLKKLLKEKPYLNP